MLQMAKMLTIYLILSNDIATAGSRASCSPKHWSTVLVRCVADNDLHAALHEASQLQAVCVFNIAQV